MNMSCFLTTRCYASVGSNYDPVSVSPCLSEAVLSKGMDRSTWFLAWRLLSTRPTLRYKEIQVTIKLRVLPSGTFS